MRNTPFIDKNGIVNYSFLIFVVVDIFLQGKRQSQLSNILVSLLKWVAEPFLTCQFFSCILFFLCVSFSASDSMVSLPFRRIVTKVFGHFIDGKDTGM